MSSKKSLSYSEVNDAFSPKEEITNPRKFVGRRDLIDQAIYSLQDDKSFMVVYGLRGVGKTSIGKQIKNIAEGDEQLPKNLGIKHKLPSDELDYIVRYHQIDKSVRDCAQLINRITFGDESNTPLSDLTDSGNKELKEIKRTLEGGFDAKLFGAGAKSTGKQEKTYSTRDKSNDPIQQFRELLGLVRKDNICKTGLLILIDEFDLLENKEGFASLVKACSNDYVKFGVIGIATNLGELIGDHASISRQIDTMKVDRMGDDELEKIIRNAEDRIGNFSFTSKAVEKIIEAAEGFPYFVHKLGNESLKKALDYRAEEINRNIVEDLLQELEQGELDAMYEDVYQSAVKESRQREILLKLFAESNDDEIHTKQIYKDAKDLGVTNPSQLMQVLTSGERHQPVLNKTRDRFYRFTDPVFKVYAETRGWKFD